MNVFRHEDKRNQTVLMALGRSVDALGEQSSPRIVGQKWHSPIAGERQLVGMPRLVDMFDSFSMRLGHDLENIRNHTAGQASSGTQLVAGRFKDGSAVAGTCPLDGEGSDRATADWTDFEGIWCFRTRSTSPRALATFSPTSKMNS